MAPRTSIEAFPELDAQEGPYLSNGTGFANSSTPLDRWQVRRDSSLQRSAATRGHKRQKSLSDAFRTIRNRKGSVSADIHEIGDALKAPVSWKLIVRSPFVSLDSNADAGAVDALRDLVSVERSHEYFLEIDSQCVP